VTVAYKTSLVLLVRLQGGAGAHVTCAAFASAGSTALTSTAPVQSSPYTAYSPGNNATVTVKQLQPAAAYSVYCSSLTTQGTYLSLGDVRRTLVTATTLCCKTVTIGLAVTSVYAGWSVDKALVVTLDGAPSKQVNVAILLLSQDDAHKTVTVYPSSVSYSNTSVVLSQYVLASAAALGTYTLSAAVTGASAAEYGVTYSGSRTLTVQTEDVPPPVPSASSARFSSDGASVTVEFDSPTNQGGYDSNFPCNKILTFPGLSAASCLWTSPATITIYPKYLGQDSTLAVGSAVLVKAGVLRAACSRSISNVSACAAYATLPLSTLNVLPPASPAQPAVVLTVPTSLGGCAALIVDAAQSVGSAGRPWASSSFSVLTAEGATPAAQQLESLLAASFTPAKPTCTVLYTDFQKGYTYSIRLSLCNFLGACASALRSVSVVATDAAVPVVRIMGQSQLQMRRASELLVAVDAYTQSCEGITSYKDMTLTWTIAQVGVIGGETQLDVKSVSQNPATYKLSPYALSAGQQYRLAVSARSVVSGQVSTAEVAVTVLRSKLVAKLAVGSQVYLTVGETLALSAAGSYDEDLPGKTGLAAGLSFAWACVQSLPQFSTICPLTLPRSVNTSTASAEIAPSAPFRALGTTSQLTVTVYDATRSSTAQVLITVSAAPAPKISISTQSAPVVNIDTGRQFALYGTVQSAAPCTASWSVDHRQVKLSAVALTAMSKPIAPDTPSAVAFNLVVAKSTLPTRSSLRFTLACGVAQSEIMVTTNGPPLLGEFSVAPPTGTELVTMYAFAASLWADEDLPLMYQFGFVSPSTAARLAIGDKSTSAFAESSLPAGNTIGAGAAVNCTLQVYDALGAVTETFAQTAVSPVAAADKAQAVQAVVDAGTGSVASTKQIISVVSSTVSAVDCTGAGNCTALHRSSCAATANLCGPCLAGFSGDSGPGNTQCLSAADLSSSAGHCTSNAQCASWWQHCDMITKRCVPNLKGCASNCTGHGQCAFANRFTGSRVATCLVTDSSCDGVCACDEGYSGAACDISSSALESQRQIRSVLVNSLLSLTAAEDVNEASTASWAESLSAVACKPQELFLQDRALVLTVANRTVQSALAAGATNPSQYIGVLQALDSVTSLLGGSATDKEQLQAYTTPLSPDATVQVLTAFADLQLRTLALGQNATSYVYENFRISAQVVELGDTQLNVTLDSPLSHLEAQTGAVPSSAMLHPAGADGNAYDTVAAKLLVVYPRVFTQNTSAFESNPLILQLQPSSSASARSMLSGVSFTLQHIQPALTDEMQGRAVNLTTVCVDRNDSVVHSLTCPGSGHVLTHNCSSGAGTHVSYCPVLGPSCAALNTATGQLGAQADCRVVQYTGASTECYCTFDDATNRGPSTSATEVAPKLRGAAMVSADLDVVAASRRLYTTKQFMSDSGAAAIVATSDYVRRDFADTFDGADEVTSLDALQKSYIVIAMLCGLWAAGLVPLMWDYARPGLGLSAKVAVAPAQMTAKQRVVNYVDNVIPAVFASNVPVLRRFAVEVLRHHSFFKMWEGETRKKRQETVFKFLTSFTFMVFLVAVFFDQGSPDDNGTCKYYVTEEDCLSRKSPIDAGQTYCEWTSHSANAGAGRCSYAPQKLSAREIMFFSVLVTIIQSIMTVPNEYLFSIMSAPTTHSLKGAAKAKDSSSTEGNSLSGSPSNSGRSSRRYSTAVVPLIPEPAPVLADRDAALTKDRSLWSVILPDSSEETVLANRLIPSAVSRSRRLAGLSLATVSAGAAVLSDEMTRTASIMRSRSSQASFRKSKTNILRGLSSDSLDSGGSIRGAELTSFSHGAVTKSERTALRTALVMDLVTHLCDDVIYQRLLMRDQSPETQQFDAQWGLVRGGQEGGEDEDGEEGYWFQASALKTYNDEIRHACTESERLHEVLLNCSEQHAGIELLHIFMVDLLGKTTPAAKIFREKFEEEFESSPTVTLLQSYAATAFLVGVNVFIGYYLVLKGHQKGLHWQLQFLWSCIAQISVEIFLFETIECVWLNYSVPAFVNTEVTAAVATLRDLIQKVMVTSQLRTKATHRRQAVVNSFFLNAPSHLFVSTKLAGMFPNLLESLIVNSYVHHLPGKVCLGWPHYRGHAAYQSSADPGPQRAVARSTALMLAFVALLVQGALTVPFGYQKVFIRLVQPLVFSALALLWYAMVSSTPVLIALCVIFSALTLLLVRCHSDMYGEPRGTLAKVAPAADASSGSERTFVADVESQSRKSAGAVTEADVGSATPPDEVGVATNSSSSSPSSDTDSREWSSDGRFSCSTSSDDGSDSQHSDRDSDDENTSTSPGTDTADEAGLYTRHANELVQGILQQCRANYLRHGFNNDGGVSMDELERAAQRTKVASAVVDSLLHKYTQGASSAADLANVQAAAQLEQEAAALMKRVLQQATVRGVDAMALRRAQACAAEATSLVSALMESSHEKVAAAAERTRELQHASLLARDTVVSVLAGGLAQLQARPPQRGPARGRRQREIVEDTEEAIWSSSSSSIKSEHSRVRNRTGESQEASSALGSGSGSGSQSEGSFSTVSTVLSAGALRRAMQQGGEDDGKCSEDQFRSSLEGNEDDDEDW
jgi:hypothetical protein